MTKERITFDLSLQEALVLFEFLSRFTDNGKLEIEHRAEERVLWDVCSRLESALNEPFAQNYEALLAEARASVRDKEA
jgi:hypothetical protein